MLVGEDSAVNELLHLLDVDNGASHCVDCRVFPVTQDAEEQMVG